MAKLSITGFHSLESVICLVFAQVLCNEMSTHAPQGHHTTTHNSSCCIPTSEVLFTLDQIQNSLTSMTVETY